MRFVVMAALAAVLSACASVDLTPQSGYPVDAKTVEYKGKTLTAGDHIVIRAIAGTFKPKDTGHSIEILAAPGRTGILLGGVKSTDPSMAGQPIQILLVRFDKQVWRDTSSSNAEVTLMPFEATIHADYVEAAKK